MVQNPENNASILKQLLNGDALSNAVAQFFLILKNVFVTNGKKGRTLLVIVAHIFKVDS